MKVVSQKKRSRLLIISTVIGVLLIFLTVCIMILQVFAYSEKQAFEKMEREVKQVKDEISFQIESDMEKLTIMANVAEKLYEDGDNYYLLLGSYEKLGLIEGVGILLKNGTFISDGKAVDASQFLDFEEEVQKNEPISGIERDIYKNDYSLIRFTVPIKSEGETVGILYGAMSLEQLEEKFRSRAERNGSRLIILEGASGSYMVDTGSDHLADITVLVNAKFKDGFSYRQLSKDIAGGKSGYTSLMSESESEFSYAYYTPLGVRDWQLIIAKPESVVFAGARATGSYMLTMFLAIIGIIAVYILIVLGKEHKNNNINASASKIRRSLLEVNQQFGGFEDALRSIAEFARSRSAFFVDTTGEDHCYIRPVDRDRLICGTDRKQLVSELMKYAVKHNEEVGISIAVMKIRVNKGFARTDPMFYGFLKKHGIKSICFSLINVNATETNLLGALNPAERDIDILFKKISVCFYMAMYNRRYLSRAETLALTDSLTGVSNRLAYNEDINGLDKRELGHLACIFIDVNELHYYNKKNGHAAGDRMLSYIASVLKNEFSDGSIYRMGGDEFLVFAPYEDRDEFAERLNRANEPIEEMKYHISAGVAFGDGEMDVEEMVNEAERRMYIEKAKYYSYVEHRAADVYMGDTVPMDTGIEEIDACLSVLGIRYSGIYYVSLKSNKAVKLLAPTGFEEIHRGSSGFYEAVTQYVHATIMDVYARTMMDFLNFENLADRLMIDRSVSVSYLKKDGTGIRLSIYVIGEGNGGEDKSSEVDKTLWLFEKADINSSK